MMDMTASAASETHCSERAREELKPRACRAGGRHCSRATYAAARQRRVSSSRSTRPRPRTPPPWARGGVRCPASAEADARRREYGVRRGDRRPLRPGDATPSGAAATPGSSPARTSASIRCGDAGRALEARAAAAGRAGSLPANSARRRNGTFNAGKLLALPGVRPRLILAGEGEDRTRPEPVLLRAGDARRAGPPETRVARAGLRRLPISAPAASDDALRRVPTWANLARASCNCCDPENRTKPGGHGKEK